MPVVLVEVGGVARSGHHYSDRTGLEYEYPGRRYDRLISSGERFVYQVPRVGYTGCGVIGDIRPSLEDGRLVCDVQSVDLFEAPVGLKDSTGHYFEADTRYWRDRIYWGQGVRPLSDSRFERILAVADHSSHADTPVATKRTAYADSKTALAVEDYSVAVADAIVQQRFGLPTKVMPRTNPGFDIRVGSPEDPVWFVEVKGTQSAEPVFFISEGERLFSMRNALKYSLIVVSGINLKDGSHGRVVFRDGAVNGSDFDLRTTQWRGQVLSTRASLDNLGPR